MIVCERDATGVNIRFNARLRRYDVASEGECPTFLLDVFLGKRIYTTISGRIVLMGYGVDREFLLNSIQI